MEYLEGRLLRYVAEEACDMANAWHALGTWAYDISKKSLDQIQLARGELSLKIYFRQIPLLFPTLSVLLCFWRVMAAVAPQSCSMYTQNDKWYCNCIIPVETMLPEEKLVVEELAGNHCDPVWNLILGKIILESF